MKKYIDSHGSRIKNQSRAYALAIGAILVLIPTLITGCRFGNKNETRYKGYDLLSGYYSTEPRTYSLQVQIEGEGSPRSKNETVNKIPLVVSEVIKNPFMLLFDDPIAGDASIRNPEQTDIGFNIKLNADTGMFTSSSSGSMQSGTGCTLEQNIQKAGSILQFPARRTVNNFSTRGSATIEYSIEHDFVGNVALCSDWLQDFKECFSTSNCDEDSTSLAHFIFDPFVDAGLITAAEIPSVREIRFTATYLEPGI